MQSASEESVHSYTDLRFWRTGVGRVEQVCHLTESFPMRDAYGSASQMRRAAVAIPCNIAQEHAREQLDKQCRALGEHL